MSRQRIGWREMALVGLLAVLVGAAQCGHDEANGESEESEQAAEAESPGGEESDDESEETTKKKESGMVKSKKKRITNPDVDAETIEELAEDNTAFGFDLYRELRGAKSDDNLFYSPYNLSHVLAMAYGGAAGQTKKQMKKALRWRRSGADLHSAFNALDSVLQQELPKESEDEEPTDALETANGVWSQKDMKLKDRYLDLLARHYGTGIYPVDFKGAPEEARTSINDWADEKTQGKITNLMPEGAIRPETRMVLTAAIYFRGRWSDTFDEENTTEADFRNRDGETATVDMMQQRVRRGWSYLEGDNYQAVDLPYGQGDYGMVVVVPDEGEFEAVEESVDAAFAQRLFDDLSGTPVDLELPKFDLSAEFSAAKLLESLGMKKAFTKSADFSAMTTDEEIFVDDVLHKAWVSVDEEGTEAAAASAAAMRATSLPGGEPDWKKVRVDRPFLFMIRHTDTDSVLFVGRVVSL